MAKRGRPKKDIWADLPDEFKALIDGSDESQCRQSLSEIGISQDLLMQAKKDDGDLAEKAAAFKDASAIYRDGSKMNKLKTRYVVERLQAMGKVA